MVRASATIRSETGSYSSAASGRSRDRKTVTTGPAPPSSPFRGAFSSRMPTMTELRPPSCAAGTHRRRPAAVSEPERFDGTGDELGVGLPVDAGNVDVELDLVAVRILDIETVGHGVVARSHHGRSRRFQLTQRLAQRVVGVADLEPEVVHTDPASGGDGGGVVAHLDEEQLVMR